MAQTPITPFRFSLSDLRLLDAVRDHYGVQSRAEAVRILLREWHRRVQAERTIRGARSVARGR